VHTAAAEHDFDKAISRASKSGLNRCIA